MRKDAKITTFMALSGGVDSTYFLWKWLSENPPKNGKTILVHHVLLHKSRKEVEKAACDKILAYLTKNGMDNFKYVETTFDRGTSTGRLYDLNIVGAISGFIVGNYRDIDTVLGCYCAEESPNIIKMMKSGRTLRDIADKERFRSCHFIRNIEYYSNKKYKYVSPWITKTKRQMIDELPQELRMATWFCRTPNEGKPCGKCFNCRRCLTHIKGYEKRRVSEDVV